MLGMINEVLQWAVVISLSYQFLDDRNDLGRWWRSTRGKIGEDIDHALGEARSASEMAGRAQVMNADTDQSVVRLWKEIHILQAEVSELRREG